MTDPRQSAWWKTQGRVSMAAFWGALAGLTLLIAVIPEGPQQVLRPGAGVGYRFTFERMRLQDQSEHSLTFIHAEEATYDRREAQVNLVAPTVIVQTTAGEELWRATAGDGIAEVSGQSELFPSALGDIRMRKDVIIVDIPNGRVLGTSDVVSYLAADQVLHSTNRTWVRMKRSTALFPYGFLMETRDGIRVRQGRPGFDLLGEYLSQKHSSENATARREK